MNTVVVPQVLYKDNNEIVLCDKCGAGKTMVLLFYLTA